MTVVSILSALLTPFIAVITTYIAYQQWQGSKLKLKMERYERRLRVYQCVVKMLKQCANGDLREFAVLVEFGAATAEGDFLFGPEIRQYLDEISTRAAKLRSANVQYKDITQPAPAGYDREKIVNEMGAQTAWFVNQLVDSIAKNNFEKLFGHQLKTDLMTLSGGWPTSAALLNIFAEKSAAAAQRLWSGFDFGGWPTL
jgi:hypothetical protein